MRLAIKSRIKPLKLLLVIILLEIFLGGGGRLLDTGILSIRMYLFLIGLFFGFILLFGKGHFNQAFTKVTMLFTATIVLATAIGLVIGGDLTSIFIDVRPLLFFYYIFFFAALIRKSEDVETIVRLLRFSAVLLAVLYLVVFVLINVHAFPFAPFYRWASYTEEFYFRGEFAFFYKGFLYLCVGLFFYRWSDSFFSKLIILLILCAVILTFTRGFILSIFLLYLFKVAFIEKRFIKLAAIITISLFLAVGSWRFISNTNDLDRSLSDETRLLQLHEIVSGVNPLSSLFGNGFGMLNFSWRETQHLEIAYAEIFLKQGLIGLLFWGYVLYLLLAYYNVATRSGNGRRARPFLLASVFTYIVSFTNPYLNNPIGITLLILSLISLHILSKPPAEIILPGPAPSLKD